MIEVIGEFRHVRGALRGLQQAASIVRLRVAPGPAPDLVLLERVMQSLLDEAFPVADAPPADPALHLVRRCVQWAIAAQRKCRIAVSERFDALPSAREEPAGSAEFRVVLPYSRAAVASLACVLEVVRRVAVDGAGAEADPELRAGFEHGTASLRAHAEQGLNTYFIVEAAYALDFPVQRERNNLLVIGTGQRARWFNSTITDRTSSIGVATARDKRRTAELLRRAGLPGGVHAQASSATEAVAVAGRLGYPVVVKPADRDQGLGVAADLRTPEHVTRAFELARKESPNVLVEKHVDGFTHRLTVFQGRLVKAARRIAGGVVGDGVNTVERLLALSQQSPEVQRRLARARRAPMTLDDEALGMLAQVGLTPGSVPAPGVYVKLRRRDNINAGGTNEAVPLERVHPDNRQLAISAAGLLRLDFAGIDLIIGDVSKSWLEVDALVCEVNAQPQMGTADTPDIYRELLGEMFSAGARVPVCLAISALDNRSPAEVMARAAQHCRVQTVAHADGLFVDGVRVSRAFPGGFDAGLAALSRPQSRSVLFVMSPEEVLRDGLPVDRVDRLGVMVPEEMSIGVRRRLEPAVAAVHPNAGRVERW